MTTKENITIRHETGEPLEVEMDGVRFPANYSFDCINDFVHSTETEFEELQYLCLGMASEIDRLRKETNIGEAFGDIYVVAVERDDPEPLKSRGAMALETMLGEADLCRAVDRASRMTRFGQATICKLLPVGSVEFCEHIINSPALDDDAFCKYLPSVFDRKQMEDHPMFDSFIRAFWRRIYPYVNDYERELPEQVPTPLICSMATALMVFEMEVRER